jgi:multicomponent Na+:H+ antiporter subunit C
MKRNSIRVIIGLMLLSNGVNLAILAMSREPLHRQVPIIEKYGEKPPTPLNIAATPYADPLPQALILTAIVIGFGVMAFLIAMVYAAFAEEKTVVLNLLDEKHGGVCPTRSKDGKTDTVGPDGEATESVEIVTGVSVFVESEAPPEKKTDITASGKPSVKKSSGKSTTKRKRTGKKGKGGKRG